MTQTAASVRRREPTARTADLPPPPADVTERGLRRVMIVAAVMAAALMQTLDSTITNVALPTIQGNLGATQDEGTWVITAYTIAAIVVIPLTPWLQQRFGRRAYFITSIVGFTIASVFCGEAKSLVVLIAARTVQGAFGGGLLVTSQSVLRDTFPPSQLAASQGIFAIGAIMGPALGPPLGGYLVDNFSWNWCFDINVVPGTFAAATLFLLLRNPTRPQPGRIDAVGLLLLALGLGSLQYVLTEGEQNYWFADPVIAAIAVVCVLALGAFGYWELVRADRPVVDLRLFRYRTVWAGSVLAFVLGVAVFGSSYVLPQFTQLSLGFTPMLSGLLFLLRAIPVAICTPIAVALSGRLDPRILLGAGFVTMGLGGFLQAGITTSQADFWDFALPLALTGIGAALMWIPLTIAVLSGTPARDGPSAAAFTNLAVQLGASIAVALLAVMLHNRETFQSSVIGGALTPASPAVQQFLARGGSLLQLAQLAYGQATVAAFADVQYAIGAIAFICIPLIFLLSRRKNAGPAAPAHVEMG